MGYAEDSGVSRAEGLGTAGSGKPGGVSRLNRERRCECVESTGEAKHAVAHVSNNVVRSHPSGMTLYLAASVVPMRVDPRGRTAMRARWNRRSLV